MANVNDTYKNFVNRIMTYGDNVICRGYETKEIISNIAMINMKNPLLTLEKRKICYRFAFAEAAWILSGDNHCEPMQSFSKTIGNFSDDEEFFAGAYGPKILDQLPYIIDCFKRDLGTRQAVINIWRERPYPSKDIPCTLSIQFFIRDNILHIVDNMRSSDAWLGVPYDWFNFSMLGAYVTLLLKQTLNIGLSLGNLYFHAASSHIYNNGFKYTNSDVEKMLVSNDTYATCSFLDIGEFCISSFIPFLWARANKQNTVEKSLEVIKHETK